MTMVFQAKKTQITTRVACFKARVAEKGAERGVLRALKQAKNGSRENFRNVAELLMKNEKIEIGRSGYETFHVPKELEVINPQMAETAKTNANMRHKMTMVLKEKEPHILRENQSLVGIEEIRQLEKEAPPMLSEKIQVLIVKYIKILGNLREITIKKNINLNELEIYNKSNVPLIENHYYKRMLAGITALIAAGGIIATYAAARLFPDVIGMTADTVNFLKNNVDTYVKIATGGLLISALLYANYIRKHTNDRIRDLRGTLSNIVENLCQEKR